MVLLIITVLFPLLVIFGAKRRKLRSNVHDVCMPKILQVLGVGFWLAEIGLSVGFLVLRNGLLGVFALVAGILAGLLFVVAHSCFIQYNKNSFWVYRLFRRPVQYHYRDITGYRFEVGIRYILYTHSGNVHISKLALGSGEFLFYARDRALELSGDIIPSRQRSLFRGNVRNPGELVSVMVIVGLLMIAASVWCTVGRSESIPENLTTIETPIRGIQSTGADIIFQTSEGNVRTGRGCFSGDDMVSLQKEIDSGNSFFLTVTPWVSSAQEKSTILWGLQSENEVYLTPADVLAHRTQSWDWAKLISWVCTVCHWLFFGFFCYVLNNGPKYPRLAALLVRKAYRNF